MEQDTQKNETPVEKVDLPEGENTNNGGNTTTPAADDILTPRKDHPRYEPTSNL